MRPEQSAFGFERDGTITFFHRNENIAIGMYMESGPRLYPVDWRVRSESRSLTRAEKQEILAAAVNYFHGRGKTLEVEILGEDPDSEFLKTIAAQHGEARLQLRFSSEAARRDKLCKEILARIKEGCSVTVLGKAVSSEEELNKILKEYYLSGAEGKPRQTFHWSF